MKSLRHPPLDWASIRQSEVEIPAHWGVAEGGPSPDYTVPATPRPYNLTSRRAECRVAVAAIPIPVIVRGV